VAVRLTGPVPLLLVAVPVAAVAGWSLAGPPAGATAITPGGCPASYPSALPPVGQVSGNDRLVPVGPVSVRLCAFPPSGPVRSRVLDPARTAALAGLLDTPAAETDDPGARARCAPAASRVLLVFRYKQADPPAAVLPELLVAVDGGPCGLVATSARVETGRTDVVTEVSRLLAP